MVRTASTMLSLGVEAPEFSLPDFDSRMWSRDQISGPAGMLVIFMCNHCPYVKHVASELVSIHQQYAPLGIGFVGISSNDVDNYPEDGPDKMRQEAAEQGYAFPYLYDESQQVAKSYRAACTPDFFLFDDQKRLVYRGQMDDSRPKTGDSATGRDLRMALDALLTGDPMPAVQKPSIGCNIKWKPGSEPDYFAAPAS